MRRIGLLLLLIVLFSCETSTSTQENDWQLVYRNDANGKTLFGEKQELLNAVRNGNPVKIGFGGQLRRDTTLTIEHVFEAHFFTILNDSEVYAQMSPIIGQNPLIEKDTTNILFRNTQWNIIVGTNGFSDRLTMSLSQDTILSQNQRKMNVSWFVKKGNGQSKNATPLWKK
ncbi:MAG: hypothetical protein AAGD17_09130 [Bacteroidota bacterium]